MCELQNSTRSHPVRGVTGGIAFVPTILSLDVALNAIQERLGPRLLTHQGEKKRESAPVAMKEYCIRQNATQ